MRTIVFCAPFLGAPATRRFVRALRGLHDVRLVGVAQEAPSHEDAAPFDHLEVVPNTLHAGQLYDAVERTRHRFGPPARILGILEDLQVPLAHLRAHYGLEGPSPEAADRFRDKGRMKDALRAAGIPCARHARVTSVEEARTFARQVGWPVVVKPPEGSGSRGIVELHHDADLEAALAHRRLGPDQPLLVEEFLTGQEGSFETICVAGTPVFHSIGLYSPRPLEVARTSWIQWVCVLPRDISGPAFDEVRRVGFEAASKLGMGTGMTHMEWFRRPNGSVAVGEIAMRPPGAQFVSLASLAHDADLYRAWARAVVDDAFDGPFERNHAVAAAYLRGSGAGTRVHRVGGLEAAQQELGDLVVEAQLPTPGAPRSSSYEGDGYVILRHEQTEVVREAAARLIERVSVTYR